MLVQVDGAVAARRHRQGHHPRHHRRDRHGRRHRPRHRICGRGDPRTVDGRPHDDLQHVDRGRCPRRASWRRTTRPSPISKGRPKSPTGETWDAAVRYWRTLQTDEGAHYDKVVRLDAAEAAADRLLGHEPAGRGVGGRHGAAPGGRRRRPRSGPTCSRALGYMGLEGGERITDLEARPDLHRVLHQRPHRRPARRGEDRRGQARGLVRFSAMIVPGSGLVKLAGREARASTASSRRRGSTGASRAARCASA